MNLIQKIESYDLLTVDMWTYLLFVALYPFTIPTPDNISNDHYTIYTLIFTYITAFCILILLIKLKILKIKYLRFVSFNITKLDRSPSLYKNAYLVIGIMSILALIALSFISIFTPVVGYVCITGMLCMRLEYE